MSDVLYKGRDNTIEWRLTRDRIALTALEYAAITQVKVTIGGVTFDSNAMNGGSIVAGTDRLVLTLGTDADAQGIGAGPYFARLVVYSLDNPQGVDWQDRPPIEVVADHLSP